MTDEERALANLSEPLTWAQICERYPDEWVMLVEIDRVDDRHFNFRSARVAGHGKTRKDPIAQSAPLRERYRCMGHYYTGKRSDAIFVGLYAVSR